MRIYKFIVMMRSDVPLTTTYCQLLFSSLYRLHDALNVFRCVGEEDGIANEK